MKDHPGVVVYVFVFIFLIQVTSNAFVLVFSPNVSLIKSTYVSACTFFFLGMSNLQVRLQILSG